MTSTVDAQPDGRIVSVNVGRPRTVEWHGRAVTTAIWKQPVSGRVALAGVNLAGDDQADRRVHGGPDKSVYAYAAEDYAWWSRQLGAKLEPGTFGENLTLAELDLDQLTVGETWKIGSAVLRVTEPRLPCFKLGVRMGDADFVGRFAEARRFGSYFAIEVPGDVAAGDVARRISTPAHSITIGEFVRAEQDHDLGLLERLAGHELVSSAWRLHAQRSLRRLSTRAGDDTV